MSSLESSHSPNMPEIRHGKEGIQSLPLVILSGPMGSGKGTAAALLDRQFGFSRIGVSDIFRERLAAQGAEHPSRKQFDIVAKSIQQELGQDGIAQLLSDKIHRVQQANPRPGLTVDGIRYIADIRFLQQLPLSTVLYFNADRATRYQRITERKRDNDLTIWDDFLAKDSEEEQWMDGTIDIADNIIDTEKPIAVWQKELHKIITDKYNFSH